MVLEIRHRCDPCVIIFGKVAYNDPDYENTPPEKRQAILTVPVTQVNLGLGPRQIDCCQQCHDTAGWAEMCAFYRDHGAPWKQNSLGGALGVKSAAPQRPVAKPEEGPEDRPTVDLATLGAPVELDWDPQRQHCLICEPITTFSNSTNYMSHVRDQHAYGHDVELPDACPLCPYQPAKRTGVVMHITRSHPATSSVTAAMRYAFEQGDPFGVVKRYVEAVKALATA